MNKNGIITEPVDVITDVKAVLGENTNDVGRLCQSSKINQYAKYKPIPYPLLLSPTDEQRVSANQGFDIPTFNNEMIGVGRYDLRWTRRFCAGGLNSPFRLTDFNGYYHYATDILPSLEALVTVHTTQPSTPVSIPVRMPYLQNDSGGDIVDDRGNSLLLHAGDFAPFRDGTTLDKAYLGIILKDGSTTYYVTNETQGIYRPLNVRFRILPIGTWDGYLFAATQPIAVMTSETGIECCGLNRSIASKITFDSSSSAAGWVIRANGFLSRLSMPDGTPSSNWAVGYSVTFVTDTSRTFPNMRVLLLPSNNPNDTPISEVDLGNINATPSNNVTREGFFRLINTIPVEQTNLYVYVVSTTSPTYHSNNPVRCFTPATNEEIS